MKLNKLTIVIPSKNELFYIGTALESIAKQRGLINILDKVVIADKSTDGTQCIIDIKKEQYPDLNIVITNGGLVSEARNNGAKLCETEYILFMDADVKLFSNWHIIDCLMDMRERKLKLYSCKIRSYSPTILSRLGFSMYNVIHSLLIKKWPFAIGGFMLMKYEDFVRFGMFNELTTNSEDFLFSQNYTPSEFGISNSYYIGQDDRRFKTIGYFGMFKHLTVNFVNYLRFGHDYFNKPTDYWGKN
jgi:glycosyltransferase involved in cell wall biosynthesis